MYLFFNNSTLERSLERAKRKSQSRLKKLESEIEIMVGTHTLQVMCICDVEKIIIFPRYIITNIFYHLGKDVKRENSCT